MTQYKNKDVVHIESTKIFERDRVRETKIIIDSHTGTHIDLPGHFLVDGFNSDDFDIQQCCGRCVVVDMTTVHDAITAKHFSAVQIEESTIVLLKTTNSSFDGKASFNQNFVYLEKTGATWLAQHKIKAVGIDYLGIERNQPDHLTHKILFEHDCIIIEGLRLRDVSPGLYTLFCLPLALVGLEALPARAILVENT